MNFEFFENLSEDEAEQYASPFQGLGRAALPGLMAEARQAGIDADCSLGSVPSLLEWIVARTSTLAREPDPTLPEWIRSSESYEKNIFDFDERSKVLVLRAAYYLGECFVQSHPCLTWSIGRVDTAEQRQPVVSGFAHSMQLAVLLVTENLVARCVTDGPSAAGVTRAIESWKLLVP